MSNTVSTLISKVGDVWCELMHDDITWPVDGHYHCKICLREYPVQWSGSEAPQAQAPVSVPVSVPVPARRIHSTASFTQRAA